MNKDVSIMCFRSLNQSLGLLALVAAAFLVSGCTVLNLMQSEEVIIAYTAEYRGLEDQRVAVIVNADELQLSRFPNAREMIARNIAARLADNMPTVEVVHPRDITAFVENNPYWATLRYSELVDRVNVDRLVVIDILEYRTHEPGNRHEWSGAVSGNVYVIDADAIDPDNPAYARVMSAVFPEGQPIGVVSSDNATIEAGMVGVFARDTAGLFYDHEVVRDRDSLR